MNISNSNTVFSSFILDSGFRFKYFLKIVCTKEMYISIVWVSYESDLQPK